MKRHPVKSPAVQTATTDTLLVRQNSCSDEWGTGIIAIPELNYVDINATPPAPPQSLAGMIRAAFDPLAQTLPAPKAVPKTAAVRRRKKLWELPPRWHCALVGTCLAVDALRRLSLQAGFDVEHLSDYGLHSAAVGKCDSRNPFTEAVQRTLDKRHAAVLARFACARDSAAVLALWQAALATGEDIPGALWAAWTHGELQEGDGQALHGDIHMLSHQNGAEIRADLRQLQQLRQANAQLRDESRALQIGISVANTAKERAVAELRKRLDAAEAQLACQARDAQALQAARQTAHEHALLTERSAALAARIETLEARNAGLTRREAEHAAEREELHASLAAAEAALAAALGVCDGVSGSAGCGKTCPAEARFQGQCVLCIGGRTGLVDGYRRLVEQRGGQFLHHDGGQEESIHRLDASLAAADAVVCQAGCVSHAAYWRLKDACKKLGKPCVFVKSPGVGSFARGLDLLTGTAENVLSAARMAN